MNTNLVPTGAADDRRIPLRTVTPWMAAPSERATADEDAEGRAELVEIQEGTSGYPTEDESERERRS